MRELTHAAKPLPQIVLNLDDTVNIIENPEEDGYHIYLSHFIQQRPHDLI